MQLTDIKAIAARSQYLLRVTLDTVYPPYNNWSAIGGQSALELAQQMAYWLTWQRVGFFIEQPIGFFVTCDLCDLQTLLYLMWSYNGWCRPSVWDPSSNLSVDPAVLCTPPNVALEADVKQVVTPTFGTNEPFFIIRTESLLPIYVDNPSPLPCYRDWVALGLGNPPGPAVDPYANVPNPWAPSPG